MLQMCQSMPNDLPCLRKYQVHPVDLPEMWVDCYPSEDTNDSEGGEIMTQNNHYRENRICLVCEKKNTRSPWTICQACGDFIVLNWNKEEYRV